MYASRGCFCDINDNDGQQRLVYGDGELFLAREMFGDCDDDEGSLLIVLEGFDDELLLAREMFENQSSLRSSRLVN